MSPMIASETADTNVSSIVDWKIWQAEESELEQLYERDEVMDEGRHLALFVVEVDTTTGPREEYRLVMPGEVRALGGFSCTNCHRTNVQRFSLVDPAIGEALPRWAYKMVAEHAMGCSSGEVPGSTPGRVFCWIKLPRGFLEQFSDSEGEEGADEDGEGADWDKEGADEDEEGADEDERGEDQVCNEKKGDEGHEMLLAEIEEIGEDEMLLGKIGEIGDTAEVEDEMLLEW